LRVIRSATAEAFAKEAADVLDGHLRERPNSVLALPTGSTPIGLYAELVRRAAFAPSSLASARVFNLDEYCGLERRDPRSFAAFLRRHLIDPVQLDEAQVHLIDGAAADPAAECARCEQAIDHLGGIDVCVLGLGPNGHLAFNEPGTPWNRRTHVATLARSTVERLRTQGWEAERAPSHGITMGLGNILDARDVLLLIAGENKRAAAAALYRRVEDLAWPVTCLLRHPRLTVIEFAGPAAPP
jgi:glucosamine-6-phosphate deaminase